MKFYFEVDFYFLQRFSQKTSRSGGLLLIIFSFNMRKSYSDDIAESVITDESFWVKLESGRSIIGY